MLFGSGSYGDSSEFSSGYAHTESLDRDVIVPPVRIPPTRPPPPCPDSLIPASRTEFILRLLDHEIHELLEPVISGTLARDTVFSIVDSQTDMALSIAAQDLISILERNGRTLQKVVQVRPESGSDETSRKGRAKLKIGICMAISGIIILISVITVTLIMLEGRGSTHGETTQSPPPALNDIRIDKILIIGGSNSTNFLYSVEVYYPSNQTQNHVLAEQLPLTRVGSAVGRLGELVLIAGGTTIDVKQSSQVIIYNSTNQSFSQGPSMSYKRTESSAVTVNDIFFICGGVIGKHWTKSCEKFDYLAFEWLPMADLPVERSGFGFVAVPNGYLYAFGGSGQTGPEIGAMDRYDVVGDRWDTLTTKFPMLSYHLAAAYYDGSIVSCGGSLQNDHIPLIPTKSCYLYKIDENRWSPMASMDRARMVFNIINFNGTLMAFGGGNGYQVLDNSVEVYNVDNDTWLVTGHTVVPRWYSSVIAI